MTERLPDRWATRDLPILRHIVDALDQGDDTVDQDTIADAVDLTAEEVEAGVRNLERGGYVEVQWFGGGFFIADMTERALRATGLWPDEQAAADNLLWVLERKVADAATPEERSRWTKIRDSFGAAGREFAVELAAAMAARSMGA